MPTVLLGRKQWVVWVCFFFSGLSGLIYEVVWVRQFELVFGVSTYAVGAVLTAFMGGLSLGAWVGGKGADSSRNPLKVYALLELLIGVYALLFPLLFRGISWIYLGLETHLSLPAFLSLMIRFLAAVLLLIFPTSLMGATLPYLSKVVVDDPAEGGWKIGKLYGVNTVGAVLGVVLSGYVLISRMGQLRTTFTAAGINLALGALVLWASQSFLLKARHLPESQSKKGKIPAIERLALFLAALSGFSALVYETCYTRILAMTLGGSVYAFSTMLATFLAGLSLGALAVSGTAFLRQNPRTKLTCVLAGAGLTALLTGFLFDRLGYLFLWLFQVEGRLGWDLSQSQRVIHFLVSAAVMTPTALFLGAAFPFFIHMGPQTLKKVGHWVGRVYSWNTLGAILGSSIAAFALVPFWGIERALMSGVFIHLAAAMVMALAAWKVSITRRYALLGSWMVLILLVFYLLPGWNLHRLAIGPYIQARTLGQDSPISQAVIARIEATDLLFYREGVATTVTVERNRANNALFLSNNGKPDASTFWDLPTQQLLSHLPLLWYECSRGRPVQNAAMVGLASGVSAGAALRHSTNRLDVVDLEPFMPEATAFFRNFNYGVLSDPRYRFTGGGGRHYLETHPGQFDVIISEPSNPWISGVSSLFTRESFETARDALRGDGVFSQWVQVYEMKLEDLKTIVRTFHSVFPYAYLFGIPPHSGQKSPAPDFVLLGSMKPLTPDMRKMDQIVREPRLRAALGRIGLSQSGDLVSLLRLGPLEISRFEGEGKLNTDDNALIEFSAPLSLYRDTYYEDLMEVRKFQEDPTLCVETDSTGELKKLLLRVSADLYPYWRRDLAVQLRDRARHL